MKQLKVWLVVGLVFLAGFTAGVIATRLAVKRLVSAALHHPELVRLRLERELDRKLKLDSRQRAEAHQVLLRVHGQLRELRVESQPRVAAILKQGRRDLDAVLTPEQRDRFDAYLAAHPMPGTSAEQESPPNDGAVAP